MTIMKPYRLCRKSVHRTKCTAAAFAAVTMLLAGHAYAAFWQGEQFVFDWTETTGKHPGQTGTVDFTLGPAGSMSGFFTLSTFTITQNGGFCGVCSPLTQNLSGILFDSTTLGLTGDVTGTYQKGNGNGNPHTYDLTIMDSPANSWTFLDTHGGGSQTSTGKYTDAQVVTSVPEPATLALLGVGLLGVGLSRRRL